MHEVTFGRGVAKGGPGWAQVDRNVGYTMGPFMDWRGGFCHASKVWSATILIVTCGTTADR